MIPKSQYRIGTTLWKGVQQTVESLSGSVMARTFDSKFVHPWFASYFGRDGQTLQMIVNKDEATVKCFHGFLILSLALISDDE